MKKIKCTLVLIFVLISLLGNLWADLPMWEIKGGKNKAYLLGSIHTLPADVYPLDEAIESAFTDSGVLIVEADATTIDQNEINELISQKAIYRDSQNLQLALEPELYNDLVQKFKALNITEEQLTMFKPWFVSMNLGLVSLQKIGIDISNGLDMHFLTKAHDKNLPIIELETPLIQMEALSSMDEQTQIDYLQIAVDDYENCVDDFHKLLKAWQEGNAESLNEQTRGKLLSMQEEFPGIINYYYKIFVNRDNRITAKLIEYLENDSDETYFVIIGALHLVGNDGILNMLEDKGYNLVQY